MTDLIKGLKLVKFKVSDGMLEEVEAEFVKLKKTIENLFWYNEFRVANAGRLAKKRPQILVGSRLHHQFPNLQTWPLLNVADVVCVTSVLNPLPCKSIINSPPSESFQKIVQRIPPAFTPDFYWDCQTEYLRPIHRGMEEAPFPTVASVCHIFYTLAIEAIYSLFDRVLPLSPAFGAQMEKKFPGKNINIPFGLNWASFNYLFKPNFTHKLWDVCLSFGPREDAPNMERRREVVEWMEEFKKKYGDKYKICISYNLPAEAYQELLYNSLISINVVGVHGPYNYRALESMALGSMVYQYDWSDGFFTNTFEGLYKDGVHGVSFTKETFEEKLLYYLNHKEEALQIARQAREFTEENYSYEKLYLKLIEEMKKVSVPQKREVINPAERIYWYQCNPKTLLFMRPGMVDVPWMQANNEMVTEKHLFEKTQELYQEALKSAPPAHRWILEWNFFLTCKQFNQPYDTTLLQTLLSHDPAPFDEERILFRLDLDEVKTFFLFNLEILKAIDDPKTRAKIYQNYCKTLMSHYGI